MEFFHFTSGEYENLVFQDVVLREREQMFKAGFEQFLKENQLALPACFDKNNEDVRFFLASKRDYQKAYDAMIENEKWMIQEQAALFTTKYPQLKRYLDAGAVYGYQRDKQHRPIIVINMKVCFEMMDMDQVDEFLDVVDLLMSYTMVNAYVPGRIESHNTIIDFKGIGLQQIPFN